jgi:hypothetical protein
MDEDHTLAKEDDLDLAAFESLFFFCRCKNLMDQNHTLAKEDTRCSGVDFSSFRLSVVETFQCLENSCMCWISFYFHIRLLLSCEAHPA